MDNPKSKLTRRQFLERSAAAGVASAIAMPAIARRAAFPYVSWTLAFSSVLTSPP